MDNSKRSGSRSSRKAPDPGLGAPGGPEASDAGSQRLDPIFGQMPASVWMTDEALTLTFIQGALLRRLSLDPAKLIGRSLADLVAPGHGDHPLIEGHRIALTGQEHTVRIEWGGRLYTARIAPSRDTSGRIVGCIGVHQEVGRLPDEEGTLRESDVRLQRVMDSNMLGIAFGNADGEITDANEAFLQLVGYSREDLVAEGISWPALTPVESHQQQIHALTEIAETGRCCPFEVDLIQRGGDRVAALIGGARLSVSRGEGVAFVLDISDRARAQAGAQSELACADALSDAATPADAAPGVFAACRDLLQWRAAALWTTSVNGRLSLVGIAGLANDGRAPLNDLARHTKRLRGPRWSEAGETFAAPLRHNGRCYGVLALVGRPGKGGCHADVLDTCSRIADRLARFLWRQQRSS